TDSELLLPIPPVLSRAFSEPAAVLPRAWLAGNYARVIDELERTLKVHPDGLLAYARGMFLTESGRMADAEVAFLTAAETPSFIPVRRAALFAAIVSAWERAEQEPAVAAKAMG